MKSKLKWANKKITSELILRTHDGFLGQITDSVVGILIKNDTIGCVQLVIIIDEKFDEYQGEIINNEVLPELRDLYFEIGIFEINVQFFNNFISISSFRELMPIDLSTYWPIFYKHEKYSR